MKILLCDMGNSSTGFADYSEGQISNIRWVDTRLITHSSMFDGYDAIAAASVVPEKETVFPSYTRFISHLNIPTLTLNLTRPEEVGADRIVNALAAYSLRNGSCLVIDSGTATTFCYVTADGVYEGGAIFPGMKLSSQALNDYTAKIPLIWVEQQALPYGKDTESAVQAGLYWGFVALINGMIAQYRAIDPSIWVVGTGNGLALLQNQLALDAYEPELVFKGLAICADAVDG